MKKQIIALLTGVIFMMAVGSASATIYYFSGTAGTAPGTVTGSATMDLTISGKTLTLLLNNTSPYPTGYSAPAITGFGFSFEGTEKLISSSFTAYSGVSHATQIDLFESKYWAIGTTQASVTLDYLPQISGMKGALYNPAAYDGLAASPNYFTTATLTMTFEDNIGALTEEYVRMQNVGIGGSLKLYGEQSTPVPEPGTMVLLGAGLFGLAVWQRRRANR